MSWEANGGSWGSGGWSYGWSSANGDVEAAKTDEPLPNGHADSPKITLEAENVSSISDTNGSTYATNGSGASTSTSATTNDGSTWGNGCGWGSSSWGSGGWGDSYSNSWGSATWNNAGAEDDAEAKRQADEAEAKRLAEEAEAKRLAEEIEEKRRAEEQAEAERQAREAEVKRQAEEAAAKRRAEEEEAQRLAEEAKSKSQSEESNDTLSVGGWGSGGWTGGGWAAGGSWGCGGWGASGSWGSGNADTEKNSDAAPESCQPVPTESEAQNNNDKYSGSWGASSWGDGGGWGASSWSGSWGSWGGEGKDSNEGSGNSCGSWGGDYQGGGSWGSDYQGGGSWGSWGDGGDGGWGGWGFQRRPQRGNETKCFVIGLDPETTTDDLGNHFCQIGDLRYAIVHTNRETGLSKGTGKVDFAHEDDAKRAIAELNDTEFRGRRISVRAMGELPPEDAAVYVGGLNFDTTEDDLRHHFAGIGEILQVSVFRDRESGRSKGSGKVAFRDPACAQQAIAQLNDLELHGRRLQVRLMDKNPRSPESRAGFGGLRPPREPNDGRQIFVGGLSRDTGTDAIRDFFSEVGEVTFTSLFTDRDTGTSKGAGKVVFSTSEEAQRALNELSGRVLEGRTITVELMGAPGERAPRGPRESDGRQLFVGSLSRETGTDSLREFFSQIGEVTFATVFMDRETGQSRGAGKVEFATQEQAQRAIRELDGAEFDGRSISVRIMGEKAPERERPPPGPRENDGRQVFVGGISFGTDSDGLREFFSRAGEVTFATIFKDRETGQPKGAGKVEFATTDQAQYAIQEFDGAELDGRHLTVHLMGEVRERPERPERPPSGPRENDGRQVFVGGLPFGCDSDSLKSFLSQVGEVTFATVFKDRETGQSKGAGKVEFATVEQAQRAIHELDGADFDGRSIAVQLMGDKPEPRERPERPPPGPRENDGRQVFVGGLTRETDSDSLKQFFSQAGEVTFSVIFKDRETGQSKGAGKVEFATVEQAQNAIEQLDGAEFDGRSIAVQLMGEFRERPERPPPGPRENDGRQLFVGGINRDTDSDALREFFSQAGEVTFCTIFKDRDTGQSKGAGKVEFATVDQAQEAIQRFDGEELDGRALTVQLMGEERKPPPPDNRSVYVGGLPWELDDSGLKDFFEQAGEVVYCTIFRDKETGRSKGSGKVQFASPEQAEHAIRELNGRELEGREIAVRKMDDQGKGKGKGKGKNDGNDAIDSPRDELAIEI